LRVTLASRMPRDANGEPLLRNWPEEVLSLIEGWELDEEGRIRKIKLTPKSKGLELAARYHQLINERSVAAHLEFDLGSMSVEQIQEKYRAVMAEMQRSHEGVDVEG
jgi:hypothetical protein